MVRPLSHIARSTVRAGGRRSVLVAALIAVAVATGAGFNVVGRSAAASPSLERHRAAFPHADRLAAPSGAALNYFGGAEARIDWWGPPRDLPSLEDATDGSAAWWTQMEAREGPASRRTQARDAPDVRRLIARAVPAEAVTAEFVEGMVPGHGVVVTTADLTDPLVSGMFETLDEQHAARDDRALMSASAMAAFTAQIGDRIRVPGVGRIQIAGRVRDVGDWSRAVMVVAAEPGRLALVGQRHSWLVGGIGEDDRSRVVEGIRRQLDAYAAASAATAADARHVVADEISSGSVNAAVRAPRRSGELWGRSPVPGAWGTAAMLIVVAVFAMVAFTVDHRRRVRHAGVLAAAGATPSQIRSIASFEALLLGAAGAAVGAAAGIAAGVVAQPLAERWLQRSIAGVTIHPLDVVGPALIGPVAAMLAARRPARAAARVAVVDALRGRPPGPRSASVLPVGAIVAPVIAAGVVRVLGVAVTPTVTGVAAAVVVVSVARACVGLLARRPRRSVRAPLVLRLALRGLGRQQARAGVVIGTLAVLVAAVVVRVALDPAAPARTVASTMGIGLLLALLVLGPTSVLGAVESDPDVRLAVAIGAAPALRRHLLGMEAAAQALMASLIGIPAGLATSALWMRAVGVPGVVVPWAEAAVIAVGLPVVAGVTVALLTRALPARSPARRIA